MPAYRSSLAASHNNLGLVLGEQGDLPSAQQHYEQASALQERLVEDFPDVPLYQQGLSRSHKYLGALFARLGEDNAARREFETALAMRESLAEGSPDDIGYWVDLGEIYLDFGKTNSQEPRVSLEWFGKAEVRLQKVLEKDERHYIARALLRDTHWKRAELLDQLNRYSEAQGDWQKAGELDDGRGKTFFERGLAQSIAMEEKATTFEDILADQSQPANAAERIELAIYCSSLGKRDYVTAAEHYKIALDEKPELGTAHRYNAACCAALALAEHGNDAAELKPDQESRWRQQALAWLSADLESLSQAASSNDLDTKQRAHQTLSHWLRDADLNGVRDPEQLDALPEHDRQAWTALWQSVREQLLAN